MKIMKLLFAALAITTSYCVFARQFDVTFDQNANFMTKKGDMSQEGGRVGIKNGGPLGLIFNRNAPTYHQICKEIVKKFNINAQPKELHVLYMNRNTGMLEPLEIQLTHETKNGTVKNLAGKKREEFFNAVQNPENKTISLFVTKLGMPVGMMTEEYENEEVMQ